MFLWVHLLRNPDCFDPFGPLQVVKWLFENRQEGCTPAAAEGAARQGHDEIVKYLKGHKRGRSVDYNDLGDVLAQART